MLTIVVEPDVREIGAFLATCVVAGASVRDDWPGLSDLIAELEEKVRREHTLEGLKEHPIVRAYRDFFWRIGIDPTKTRPSAEALVRRILSGRGLPRINNVVDAGNIASVETLVPIGLYDFDRLKGTLRLRFAEEGEEFHPIGGRPHELSGGVPVLADDEGVIHLFPHRDSVRTMIRPDTSRVLAVACGVPRVDEGLVVRAARRTAELIVEFAGASTAEGPKLHGVG